MDRGHHQVQVTACRVFGTKSLHIAILTYENVIYTSPIKFESRHHHIHLLKYIWKFRLQKVGQFVQESTL